MSRQFSHPERSDKFSDRVLGAEEREASVLIKKIIKINRLRKTNPRDHRLQLSDIKQFSARNWIWKPDIGYLGLENRTDSNRVRNEDSTLGGVKSRWGWRWQQLKL